MTSTFLTSPYLTSTFSSEPTVVAGVGYAQGVLACLQDTWEEPTLTINFGPQHPAAHGVLRLLLRMQGERCIAADPNIGLLHRGTEKLIENKGYLQSLPYFDRLDYVSCVTQEHAFCLAVEGVLNKTVHVFDSVLRVLFSELARILNHVMCLTTHAMDVGALTPFLWLFEEREILFEFFERLSGARMHSAYMRPGGVAYTLPGLRYLSDLLSFLHKFDNRVDELEDFLSDSRIWKQRTRHVGFFDAALIESWSASGVVARACGFDWDLRKDMPYEVYDLLSFSVPVSSSKNSDTYERYFIRVLEMRESLRLSEQCVLALIRWYPSYATGNNDMYSAVSLKQRLPEGKEHLLYNMEALIEHFASFSSKGRLSPTGSIYTAVESPKGEFGVTLHAAGGSKAERCKIKSPGYFHLQSITAVIRSMLLADVVAFIGSVDIVFGEVDR